MLSKILLGLQNMLKQQGKKVLNFKRRVIKPKTCRLRVFPRAECLISTLHLNSIREYWRLAAVAVHDWILVEVIASAPCAECAQSCLTLWDPSGSSVHGDSPGKNTGVGCHFPFQGLLPNQGFNLCLLHWQANSLPHNHLGNPRMLLQTGKIWD